MAETDNVKHDDNFRAGLLAEKDNADRTPTPLKVDETTERLKVDSNSGNGSASVGTFRKVVTTAGTRVQLDDHSCKKCIVQALEDNTDAVEVGDVNVVAAKATQRGLRLFPTQYHIFNISNTNLLYIDSVVNGEGVSVIFEE